MCIQLGEVTYVAGQIGMAPACLDLVSGLAAQCRLSLRHVTRVLAALSPASGLRQVVLGVCYVTRRPDAVIAAAQFKTALTVGLTDSSMLSSARSSYMRLR